MPSHTPPAAPLLAPDQDECQRRFQGEIRHVAFVRELTRQGLRVCFKTAMNHTERPSGIRKLLILNDFVHGTVLAIKQASAHPNPP
jgi:hypothetical protein